MQIRRSMAAALIVAFVASGSVAIQTPLPVSAAGPTAQLPTAENPANFTPNVLNGEVDSIWQVGNTVIIGGTFTQVANSKQNGGAGLQPVTASRRSTRTTGVVNPNFAPVARRRRHHGHPRRATAARSTSVATSTRSTGPTVARSLRINLANGSLVTGFNANGVNGLVQDMRLVGNELFIAGSFTTVGGQPPRTSLASLNATTGAVTTKLEPGRRRHQNDGTTSVIKFDVTPGRRRMLIIGNFRTVDGQDARPDRACSI